MTTQLRSGLSMILVAAVAIGAGIAAYAQSMPAGDTLGTVRLGRAVMADGQALAAGTYAVRLTDDAVKPVVGQSVENARWVEFVQGGAVKGRELATVLMGPAVKQVAKEAPPAAGRSRVEPLLGGQYLRVWINHDGTNYLIHLAIGAR